MNSKRAFVQSVFLLSAGGGWSKDSPTHCNPSVLLAFGIQLTINRDSLRFTLSSTLTGGGGGCGPPARIVEAFDALIKTPKWILNTVMVWYVVKIGTR